VGDNHFTHIVMHTFNDVVLQSWSLFHIFPSLVPLFHPEWDSVGDQFVQVILSTKRGVESLLSSSFLQTFPFLEKKWNRKDGLSLTAREAALNKRKWAKCGWLGEEAFRCGQIPQLAPHSGTFIQWPPRSSHRQVDGIACSYTMCHTILLGYSSLKRTPLVWYCFRNAVVDNEEHHEKRVLKDKLDMVSCFGYTTTHVSQVMTSPVRWLCRIGCYVAYSAFPTFPQVWNGLALSLK
jgi:hypothetical protein